MLHSTLMPFAERRKYEKKNLIYIPVGPLPVCSPCQRSGSGKGFGVKAKTVRVKGKSDMEYNSRSQGISSIPENWFRKFHRIKSTGKKSYTVSGLTPGIPIISASGLMRILPVKEIRKILFFRKDHDQKQLCSRKQVITVSLKSDTYKKNTWTHPGSRNRHALIMFSVLIWNTFSNIGGGELHLEKEPITCSFLCIFLPIPLLYLRTGSRSNGRTRGLFSSFAVTMT